MVWILLARHSHQQHEVSRMTCRHQYTLTLRCLVNWGIVALELFEFCGLARHEFHHRALGEKDLRITLVKGVHDCVPLATFHVHSIDVDTIFWHGHIFFIGDDFEIVSQKIDSNTVLSRIILLSTRQETLSEEESCDPKHLRKALFIPFLEPLKSTKKIFHVSCKTLQRWERYC